MVDFENIIYEVEENTGWITLNRPERLNALSRPLLAEVEEALNAARDDENVRAIVIKGAGRAFSAGYDMNVQTQGERRRDALFSALSSSAPQDMYKRAIWDNPKPVIAQVHSFTLAGGGHLACHCDITIASDDALFGYPPVRYASVMMPLVWPELVGMKKAKQMAFTGSMITAQEALRVGLVSEVVPRDDLDDHVKALAKTIAKLPPESTHL
ncbi:MAG: enoyl-CoA hydratase/isomerase family protein, partial [Dehalococcoidia bacterium]|nr:enoyl-CoA hydratase/isomerase family protein [Dehalococcoidia bacterium]